MNFYVIKKLVATILHKTKLIKLAASVRTKGLKKPRIIVLCYHRIVEQGGLISPQCISPKCFEEQVCYFKNHFSVINMTDLERYMSGDFVLLHDAVLFTFDDGYEDNYTHAMPILEKYGLKGCFFVASDPVLKGRPYWVDELSTVLQALHKHKHDFNMSFDGLSLLQRFIDSPECDKGILAKQVFYYVNELPLVQRNEWIHKIRLVVPELPKTPALMNLAQLKNLMELGHCIGAHTVSHPKLSLLNREQVEHELIEGILSLRQQDIMIDYFAYPFGKIEDFPKERTYFFSLLKKYQIKLAVTTEDAAVDLTGSPYLVHRKVMSAQSLAQIALKLEMLKWQFNLKNA